MKKKYCFFCTKCKFEAKEEKKLEDHIKKKHGAIKCAVCTDVFERSMRMMEHMSYKPKKVDCQMCNFETYNARELENHVQSMLNKLIPCKECDFEAASCIGSWGSDGLGTGPRASGNSLFEQFLENININSLTAKFNFHSPIK